eukprot:CAMPEP_0168430878 /NCGR_PEP_ID=MMETSP0228-20121227/38099_1 /TAXON_ID=133427 /ORGANISM="Protoceratium reticulatum, Strain CCCM 535 (=CCMP 1889)" /LENGTH=236 /DNA_ID=CAMNT_0008444981 /DNA_START=478 /DNA_END=1185 /DNA_ORIENTATION=+
MRHPAENPGSQCKVGPGAAWQVKEVRPATTNLDRAVVREALRQMAKSVPCPGLAPKPVPLAILHQRCAAGETEGPVAGTGPPAACQLPDPIEVFWPAGELCRVKPEVDMAAQDAPDFRVRGSQIVQDRHQAFVEVFDALSTDIELSRTFLESRSWLIAWRVRGPQHTSFCFVNKLFLGFCCPLWLKLTAEAVLLCLALEGRVRRRQPGDVDDALENTGVGALHQLPALCPDALQYQ